MIAHCIIGQAGSGKSTFIDSKFNKDDFIFYSVGNMLRGMFSCLKGNQKNNNVWDFANPLVYSVMKHCILTSNGTGYPVVFDGLPRNSNQLQHLHTYLTSPKLGEVEVVVHCLDIDRSEQINRIRERNGEMDDYQMTRIQQSRNDFEGVIDSLETLVENKNHEVVYTVNWYKQLDGGFILESSTDNK
jgi:adenylate kinase family enzyme